MPKNQIKVSEVKRTRQKGGTVVTVDEFLQLDRPKGDLALKVGREQVSVTSLDRIYWPDEKLTKFDLLSYYLKVADYIMPFLQDRPAILQRYPRGIKAPMFFQQDLDSAPAYIKTARLTNQEGRQLDYGVYSTVGSLLHFVTLGTIEQHPWHSTIKRLDKPDWIAIDLDPKKAPWENVLQVALVVKEVAAPACPSTKPRRPSPRRARSPGFDSRACTRTSRTPTGAISRSRATRRGSSPRSSNGSRRAG